MRGLRFAAVPLALAIALMSTAVIGATRSVAASIVVPNPIDQPAWASAANLAGQANAAERVEIRLWLTWNDAAGADALATAVSSPTSPQYRHYLTSTQFIDRFAPSASAVTAVQHWAAVHGLQAAEVPASRIYVGVTGTVAQLNSLFRTQLDEYRVQGMVLRAPSSRPVLPADLPNGVRDITGLDQHDALLHPFDIGPNDAVAHAAPAGFANAPPCSQYHGQITDTVDPTFNGAAPSYVICGNTPETLRQIYGLTTAEQHGITGTGYTVVVIDAWDSPTMLADANQWSQNHGVPKFGDPGAGTYTDDSPPGLSQAPETPVSLVDPAGWSTEQSLDVETIHGVAPGANIAYVGAASPENGTLEVAETNAIAQHLGDEISNSWGGNGDGSVTDQSIWNELLTEATSTGIGVYFSSGDSSVVEFPSALPGVTAIGGTSVELGKDGTVGLETGWQTAKATLGNGAWTTPAYQYGGGGGITTLAEPSYQQGVVPTSLSGTGSSAVRVVPDISALGDPNTGYIIGQTQAFSSGTAYGEFREGGTSLACPLMAAIMALASQQQGSAVGFANPALYKLYGSGALRDVQPLSIAPPPPPPGPCTYLFQDTAADAPDPVSSSQDPNLDIVNGSFSLSPDGKTLRTVMTLQSQDFSFQSGDTAIDYQMIWSYNGTAYATDASLTLNPNGAPTQAFSDGTIQILDNPAGGGLLFSQYAPNPSSGATGSFTSGSPAKVEVDVPLVDVGSPGTGAELTQTAGLSATGQGTQAQGSETIVDQDPSSSTFGNNYVLGTGCVALSVAAPAAPLVYGEVRNDYQSGTSGPTTTSLRVFDATPPAGLTTAAGYDDVTGIGTPNGTAFLAFGEPSGGMVAEAPMTPLLIAGGVGAVLMAGVRRRRRRGVPYRA